MEVKKKEVEKVLDVKPKKTTAADLRRQKAEFLKAQRIRENHLWKSQQFYWVKVKDQFEEDGPETRKLTSSFCEGVQISLNNFDQHREIPSNKEISLPPVKYQFPPETLDKQERSVTAYYLLGRPKKFCENHILLEKVEEDSETASELLETFNLTISEQEQALKTLKQQLNRVKIREERILTVLDHNKTRVTNKLKQSKPFTYKPGQKPPVELDVPTEMKQLNSDEFINFEPFEEEIAELSLLLKNPLECSEIFDSVRLVLIQSKTQTTQNQRNSQSAKN